MDRRTLLARTGVIMAAAGTGLVIAPAAGASSRRPDSRPLLEWDQVGGFVGPGITALRPARLAIYPDGRAIADAERLVRLNRPALAELYLRAVTVLSNPANGHRRPGAPVIADIPSTVFRTGCHAIQAEGLEESRSYHAYPEPLYGLLDRLDAVRAQAAAGRRYLGDGVRLVAVSADGATPTATWPRGIRVPHVDATHVYGVVDLHGAPAALVVRRMPRRDPWQWPVYRLPDGRSVRATWRYLLPYESAPMSKSGVAAAT